MNRTIILYGLGLAAMVTILKLIEYKYFVRQLSLEFYLAVVATLFAGLGVWVGRKLTYKKVIRVSGDFKLDESMLDRLGISRREHEVLALIASGLSNQEIADRLFVSLNTVKTHSSNLFLKLEVKRRTQAIQKGKELGLIP
ncbi:MAG: DNA-binding response regulator [Bacteroidetes bacterium]|nr:DNA-binding response regulator [Bacteroidota bacterium]